MPSPRRFLLALVAALVALATLGPARPAHAACTCTATTPAQGMQDSSLVFVGSLTEIQPAADNLVELHFDVRLSFKGDVGATVDVASFASAEDCGIGETARRGSWLVFAYTFPGGSGLPLLSTCSPSTPLVDGSDLPIELGKGVVPAGVIAEQEPVVTAPVVLLGTIPDPNDGVRAVAWCGALIAGIGVTARLLAGRRRLVVR